MPITLLFTDVEGSTALFEKAGADYEAAMRVHHALIRAEVARHDGREFHEAGDGFKVAFHDPAKALNCAVAIQRGIEAEPWPPSVGALRVRVALHTGEAELRDGQYRGLAMNRAARILAATHGRQILCSGAAAQSLEGSLPVGVRLEKLGLFRLRGIAEPEPLHQIVHPALRRVDFPPPVAILAQVRNAPAHFTPFIGRQREIEELADLLQAGDGKASRLITLTGPGGTGKTRLSLAVAQNLAESGAREVAFVPLADLADPRLLAETVRDALGLPPLVTSTSLAQVIERLGVHPSALVLDNFEQLALGGSDFVLALLRGVPSLVCLVSSRQRLGVPAEREFPVASLPLPGSRASLDELRQNESVQLFLDRLQTARPGFELTEQNAEEIAAICHLLDGSPLALELAAARAQVLTTRDLWRQLQQRLDFPPDLSPSRPARHRSLQAAIDWSFDALLPEQQRFFCALGVFRGGWTAESAAFVAGKIPPMTALNHLYQLRNCSLIVAEESTAGMRYRMLETLRQYAEDRLDENANAARSRHAEFFEQLGQDADWPLRGTEQAGWLARLEAERDNLRTALAFESHKEKRLRLAVALQNFWLLGGHAHEGRQWIEQADDESFSADLRAWAHGALGSLCWALGDLAAARTAYEQALDYCRGIENRTNVATLLHNLAILRCEQGDYAGARPLYLKAITIFDERGLDHQRRTALRSLGTAALLENDLAIARECFERCRPMPGQTPSPSEKLELHDSLGCLAGKERNFCASLTAFAEALTISFAASIEAGRSDILENVAEVLADTRDFAGTVLFLSASDALRQDARSLPQPRQHARIQRLLEEARGAMSAEDFSQAWRDGRQRTNDEITGYVRESALLHAVAGCNTLGNEN